MRAYLGLLLFENLFDNIPTINQNIVSFANSIFRPNLPIVESNCNTTLGKYETVNFESEGYVELSTGLPLSRTRIEQLLGSGIYSTYINHTSTCISQGGVCATCYQATYPDRPNVNVLDRVTISPEYVIDTEIIPVSSGISSYNLVTDPLLFTKTYAFRNGSLVSTNTYSVSTDGVLTFASTPTETYNLVVRCVREDTSPFLIWLARTYSGSLFGMKSMPSQSLLIKNSVLASQISENMLQLIIEYVFSIKSIPDMYQEYVDTIRDPLEKALFLIALYCLYINVTE